VEHKTGGKVGIPRDGIRKNDYRSCARVEGKRLRRRSGLRDPNRGLPYHRTQR